MPTQRLDVSKTIEELLDSSEPSIRWKIRTNVLGEDPVSASLQQLQAQTKKSSRVSQLLDKRDSAGRLQHTGHVYSKWQGAHWIMATLADIGYPGGDKTLEPVRDQLLETWLHEGYYQEFNATTRPECYKRKGVPVMEGRHRRCASQQSNALWSILKLDLANQQTENLVERLLHWQWPDGGWNCDKNPHAHHSSYMESIIPLRALALYARITGDQNAAEAAKRAAEIFLKRHLFLRQSSGSVITPGFLELHYPLYWHYDILGGLKVMAECGFICDPRCEAALNVLIEKQLPDGGWAAEKKYYKLSDKAGNGIELIDWGGTSKVRMNEWVTADALFVLQKAGLLDI
jgi:hypothetical protein